MPIEFKDRLIDLMFENGEMTAQELASRINVNPGTVRQWRAGQIQTGLSNLLSLANVFSCSLDFLCGRTQTVLDYSPVECPAFYQNLRKVMEEKNISRYAIARNTSIKDTYFTRWSRGTEPNIESLITLADYMHVTVDYLVGREK